MLQNWVIYDWAGNDVFGFSFYTFDQAEEYLCEFFDKNELDYEIERGEYWIKNTTESQDDIINYISLST